MVSEINCVSPRLNFNEQNIHKLIVDFIGEAFRDLVSRESLMNRWPFIHQIRQSLLPSNFCAIWYGCLGQILTEGS